MSEELSGRHPCGTGGAVRFLEYQRKGKMGQAAKSFAGRFPQSPIAQRSAA